MKTIGILRKTNYQQIEVPDLLVFGYQSKLYRNDVKALELDRETHLIPAPYDKKDQISRYDVRATLEMAPSEPHGSYMNRLDYLSPAEQQAEMMAEKERYYSLYINEVEEEMYKEEQLKRDKTDYNQFAFSYDEIGPKESSEVPTESQAEENDTTPFTPSVKLDLPVDMEIPPTLKLNQIIEKTAKFISSQGPQMEILLKTKQAANPQFNFLNHDGQFNSYYKHILSMMKTGTYPWQEEEEKTDENSQDSEDFKVNGRPESPTPSTSLVIPKITYKPSADCTYTQLISKITKAPISELEKQKQQETEQEKNGNGGTEQVKKSSGLLGLVHYSSDSESEAEESASYSGPTPPSELQIVIDKTAVYVAKNGVDFEQTLRKKQDARFQFLDATNEFHQYYIFKVNESRGTLSPQPPPREAPQPPPAPVIRIPKVEVKLPKTPPAPVSFSIKPKEEKSQLKPTILQAGSDDEVKIVPEAPEAPRITTVEEELEMQVDAMNAEREEKLAKSKLSEKLLSAARERLGMLPKEKMLQIERKKKAMMFINQIKGSNGNSVNGGNDEEEIINLTHYGEDSEDSVKSIPVNSSPAIEKPTSSRSSRSRKRSSSSSSRSRSSTPSSSRSRSRSSSRSHSRKHSKSKKSKSKKSKRKKKYRKRSRSRSRSYSGSRKRDRHDRRY